MIILVGIEYKKTCCVKCGKAGLFDVHHILYKPVKVALLCKSCHKAITNQNASATVVFSDNKKRVFYMKLTNEQRMSIWSQFLST